MSEYVMSAVLSKDTETDTHQCNEAALTYHGI